MSETTPTTPMTPTSSTTPTTAAEPTQRPTRWTRTRVAVAGGSAAALLLVGGGGLALGRATADRPTDRPDDRPQLVHRDDRPAGPGPGAPALGQLPEGTLPGQESDAESSDT